jgi:hypothetical protein
LLCGSHHDQERRGLFSNDYIRKANENPWCKQHSYTRGLFHVGRTLIAVHLGLSRIRAKSVLVFDGEDLLGFDEPEAADAPWRLSARFGNEQGQPFFEIIQNEWRAGIDRYDVVTEANRLTIREKSGEIILLLSSVSEVSLRLERLRVRHKDHLIEIENGVLRVIGPTGQVDQQFDYNIQCMVMGADIGISLTSGGGIMTCGGGGSAVINLTTGPAMGPIPKTPFL